MIVIGIDPGLTGALAKLNHAGQLEILLDMPTMQRAGGGATVKNQVDGAALAELLRGWIREHDRTEIHVVIEKAQPMPGKIKGKPNAKPQGSASTFSMGLTAGIIEGVVVTLGLAHEIVHPATWKAKIKPGTGKEAARAHAIRLYPGAQPLLGRVMDHNRAEALLIARYGREKVH